MKHWILLLGLTCSVWGMAQTCESRGPNVILFTWDGVRSHEFFHGTGLFHHFQLPRSERGTILKKFWSKHAQEGVVLGKYGGYKIGSKIAISLPSYQALMVGHATPCMNNSCEDIKEETVLESVRSGLNLPKKDVAVFASWNKILSASASNPSQITHGIYPDIFDDGSDDPTMREIQKKGMEDLPKWEGSRKDQYTFELGMHYLKKHCPRLLYISLVDSDEYGHEKDYPNYVQSLKTYDHYLDQVIETLKQMGDYGQQTTLIVSTDHSRGQGPFWVGHAVTKNSEKRVFLYARGRGVKPTGISAKKGGHVNIKPTIEYLMGLKPSGNILPHINVD